VTGSSSLLIIAQADHLTGETLGASIGDLLELGAVNAQIMPTITKKNRPGHMIFIDLGKKNEKTISEYLAKELRITGYHRMEATHVHQKIGYADKTLLARFDGGSESFPFRAKIIGDPASPISIDVEIDFLVSTRDKLDKDHGVSVSLTQLRNLIEARLSPDGETVTIDI